MAHISHQEAECSVQRNAAAPPKMGELSKVRRNSNRAGKSGGTSVKMAWRRGWEGGLPLLSKMAGPWGGTSWSHMPVLASSEETVKGVR